MMQSTDNCKMRGRAHSTSPYRTKKIPKCDVASRPPTYRGAGKGSGGIAVRLARRRPGAAADGLFPSMRHSSARSGATAAALESRLRGSGSAPAQQHRIAARRRGQDAAPLAVVRSNGGHARPLEHAAIFSCHGEAGPWGAAAAEAGWCVDGPSSGGRREAEGRVLYEWWGGGRRCASLLRANESD